MTSHHCALTNILKHTHTLIHALTHTHTHPWPHIHALQDWADGLESESLVSCLLSKELGLKLSSIFGKSVTLNSQNERQVQKRKRKEQLLQEKQKGSAVSVPKIVPKGVIEDIFADVGRYMPVGMLEEGEERSDTVVPDNERANASTMSVSVGETGKAKGLFSNLLPSFPSKIKMAENSEPSPKSSVAKNNAACVFEDSDNDEDDIPVKAERVRETGRENERKHIPDNPEELEGDDKRISGGVEGDLMAPIRAMLAAQAVKEKAALARSEARASNSEGAFIIIFILCKFSMLLVNSF
jgi:hypothetical protein